MRQARRSWQARWERAKDDYADSQAMLVTVGLHAMLLLAMMIVAFSPSDPVGAIDTVQAGFADSEEEDGFTIETVALPETELADPVDAEPQQIEIDLPAPTVGLIDPLAVKIDERASDVVVPPGGGRANVRAILPGGDAIAKRVQRAGGRSGEIQFSLAWDNRSDLDLHILTPDGEHIWYRRPRSGSGGFLDVDMNVQGESTEPVENVQWSGRSLPDGGRYRVGVHLYKDRNRGKATSFQLRVKIGDDVKLTAGTVTNRRDRWERAYYYKP